MSREPSRMSNVTVTAGPTLEKLDDVRYISNFSTGKMGYEIAAAALKRGYNVTLISGPTALAAPSGARVVETTSTKDMLKAVEKSLKGSDCLIMTSAVCDWRPEKTVRGKIKSQKNDMSLRLVRTPDILGTVSKRSNGRILVGFALESGGLIKNAEKKLKEKDLDLIVANRIGKGSAPFGSGKTSVTIIDRHGARESHRGVTKGKAAGKILDKAEKAWREKA